MIDSYRWLTGVLRGESSAGAGIPTDRYASDHLPLFHAHLTCAIATAIFGDQDGLARHTAAAKPLLPAVQGVYPAAVARLLRGLALAGEARTGPSAQRAELLSELDDVIRWLAGRAEDAPENFLHLQRLLEAERAWAVGDFRAAVLAFDTAQHEVAGRRRPWHKALIAERAARFHLGHGLDHAGHALLAEARQHYAAWGATAKVAQLDRTYPDLRPGVARSAGLGRDQPADGPAHGSTVTTGTLDLLGILSASRALSSETDLEKLHARVIQVLGALTGATDVHLLLWSDDQRDWMLPQPWVPLPRSPAPAASTRRRCPCCATSSAPVSPSSSLTPPTTTASPATRTSPISAAAHWWPSRSFAEAGCTRCCCSKTTSSAARSPPSARTRSS